MHLVEILRDHDGPTLEIVFGNLRNITLAILVLDHQAMLEATESILDENGIRYSNSPDLNEVWAR
ncbi:MAG: hypothetical protein J6386_09140 [Candidatus Synoicihabitans palmerolidicus]|nr:hypothetical protein [Candidatus Synoicihabitans palmerolidicus]